MDIDPQKERTRLNANLLSGKSAFTVGMFTDQEAFYDQRAEIYDEQNERPDRAERRKATEAIYHEKLKNLVAGKNLTYLDFGGGTGTSTQTFLDGLEKYAHIEKGYAMDISSEMVKIAQKKLPNFIVAQGTAENLNFDNDFNLITSFFHVLCHLAEDELDLFFKNAHQSLNKGGLLCFDVVRQFDVGEHRYTQEDQDAGRKYLAYHSLKKDGSKVLATDGSPMLGTDRMFTKDEILGFAKKYHFEATDISELSVNNAGGEIGVIREFLVILTKN